MEDSGWRWRMIRVSQGSPHRMLAILLVMVVIGLHRLVLMRVIGNQRMGFQAVTRYVRLKYVGGTGRFLKTDAVGFRLIAIGGDIVVTIARC